jgi:formylglycine-generating enzyme required for sulfatase activity
MRKKKEELSISVTPVKLKPIFGLNPPVYLTIIYVSIILIILFVVGFLPGIISSGKRVTFNSPVAFSSVYIDDNYVGTTPITTFLSPGEHSVLYSYKDVGSVSETIDVSHPLFLTWLIPRTQSETSDFYLDESSISSYLDEIKREIIRYSAVLEYDDVTHYPPLFESAINTLIEGNITQATIIDSFLLDSSLFITSHEMLDDVTKALDILEENNYDIKRISDEVIKIASLFDENSSKSTPLEETLETADSTYTTLAYGSMRIEGSLFEEHTSVIGKQSLLTYPGVEQLQQEVTVESFTISNREISEYQYAQFIEENRKWAKNNIDSLIEEGLVDEAYLEGIFPTTSIISTIPIRNISYYAAKAFSEWVAKKSGKEVMLPSNNEIELAISASNREYQKSLFMPSNILTPIALLGGVWELTRDEYIPLTRYLQRTIEDKELIEDVIIKGGSYLNNAATVDKASIGVMKKNQCSATTGFRIVWK